ncbi:MULTISPECIES: hypothetical protein [Nocardia]|uniref:hypothetical protein n=1 Tax=Nocardia TaxID=1817 RepID=UPI001300BD52|nr:MULTISPECIES: hypothetical protein [Nocardia]
MPTFDRAEEIEGAVNEQAKWRENGDETYTQWRRRFNASWNSAEVPGSCPVCGSATLHRWYVQEDSDATVLHGVLYKGRGRLWEWCSTCRTFEHLMDGFVPAWWVDPYPVAPESLRYDPGPIEAARGVA